MRRRKYRFTDKNQSRQGIISSAIGVASLVILIGVLAAAYMQYGRAGKLIAVFGVLALILSAVGMYYGVNGTREEDTYHLFPWLGCGMNGLVLAAVVMSYILGW